MDIATVRSRRFLILLSALGLFLVVQSLNQGLGGSAIITDVFVIAALLAVFFVVFERSHQRLTALAAALAAIAITEARYVLPNEYHVPLAVAYNALLILSLSWAVVEILRGLFVGKAVQRDDIFGALSGYLIAGSAWANLYALSELLFPGSFSVSPDIRAQLADWHGRQTLFNYFSFVTLATMGYGDVTAIRVPATTLVLVEAVFGQFYVAVVVAQIVGMRLAPGVAVAKPEAK